MIRKRREDRKGLTDDPPHHHWQRGVNLPPSSLAERSLRARPAVRLERRRAEEGAGRAGRPLGAPERVSSSSRLSASVKTSWGRQCERRLFPPICIFNVEPQSYGRELKKYVHKIEIEQNLYPFIANDSYGVITLKY